MESLKLAQKRSTGTLRPCKAESVNFDETQNLYIEGDNLEVLKLLQTAYYNKIKMIYIDPPYNTGNDFVYEDDFADPMARYKEVTSQTTKSNPETMGRYHTNWLNMMYPRLRLASNLLTDDGVIFISIDDNEITNLRKICNEIFGEENFIGTIIIKSNPRGSMSTAEIAGLHEYLVLYCKNRDCVNVIGHELSENMTSEYKYTDENGAYRLLGLRMRGGFWRRTERPNLYFPIYINPENGEVSLEKSDVFCEEAVPVQPSTMEDGTWRWSKDKISQNTHLLFGKTVIRDGETVWDIYQKDYLNRDEGRRTKAKSIWDESEINYQNGTTEIKNLLGSSAIFDYSKPIFLIEQAMRMIDINAGDVILDFFSGSATTAHAVMHLNAEDMGSRKFICVQLPETCDEKTAAFKEGYKNICEIGKERIRRAGKKILEENAQTELGDEKRKPLDVGFKVFKLDTSNLKTWDGTPIEDKQIDIFYERLNSMIDTVKDDRTDMDVVYEVMLKMGIPLDVEVQYMEIGDKIAYIVGDFILMICLAKNITAEDIENMAQYAPAKIICAEAGFADDSALSNAHYILKDRSIELKLV